MLPGKKYTPEDIAFIAWTRKWFILVPAVVIAFAVFIYVRSIPDRYRSTATVLVIGQQVPKDLIRPTVTDTVEERLRAIQQETVNRTKLERIIDENGLYKKERADRIMEDIIEQMRNHDLEINVPRTRGDTTSFSVSFTAEKPRLAMQVADQIASLFVKTNADNREAQAGSTSQFLDNQLDEARNKMKAQDEKIAQFSRSHAGTLPTQLQTNMQMVTQTQLQIEANADGANKDRDAIANLDSKMRDLEDRANITVAAGPAATDSPAVQAYNAKSEELRTTLLTKGDRHPDVVDLKHKVAELKAKVDAEAQNAPVSPAATGPAVREADMDRLLEARNNLRELRADEARRAKEDQELRGKLAQYTSRLDNTPGVESEYADLVRDQSTQREQYEELLKKRDTSKLAENLERRQIGEQFKVIDSARLPERPVFPPRDRYNMMGIFGGLAFGIALAGFLEYRDTTLKSDDDIVTSLSLPVLAVIPAMTNAIERTQQRRRTRMMVVAASVASVVLVGAALAWKYRLIQDWIR